MSETKKMFIYEEATCLVNAMSSFHTTILGIKNEKSIIY